MLGLLTGDLKTTDYLESRGRRMKKDWEIIQQAENQHHLLGESHRQGSCIIHIQPSREVLLALVTQWNYLELTFNGSVTTLTG